MRRYCSVSLAALVAVTASAAAIADDAGVVRISDRPVVRAQSPSEHVQTTSAADAHCETRTDCPDCEYAYSDTTLHAPATGLSGWWHRQTTAYYARNYRTHDYLYGRMLGRQATAGAHGAAFRARNVAASAGLHSYLRCKYGYFIPTGGCGRGVAPHGQYDAAYPVNPYHYDARDGKLYASEQHGVPTGVPLAPVVNYQYNYGWGVPSSRLTPVMHTLPASASPVVPASPHSHAR